MLKRGKEDWQHCDTHGDKQLTTNQRSWPHSDVSQTLAEFLAISPTMVPPSRSTLTLQDVDNWLGRITTATKESDQTAAVKRLLVRQTAVHTTTNQQLYAYSGDNMHKTVQGYSTRPQVGDSPHAS